MNRSADALSGRLNMANKAPDRRSVPKPTANSSEYCKLRIGFRLRMLSAEGQNKEGTRGSDGFPKK